MSVAFIALAAFFVLLAFLKSVHRSNEPLPDTTSVGQDPFVSEKDAFVTPGNAGKAPEILLSDPKLGPEEADVTIMAFSDFQCSYCADTHQLLEAIQKKYSKDVRIVWKDFPLPTHGFAMTAALAGRCAAHQQSFWEYSSLLFQKLSSIDPLQTSEMFETLLSTAEQVGLQKDSFQECVESKRYADEVGDSFTQGLGANIDGVPYLFINDQPFSGQPTLEGLEGLVKNEL